MQQKTDPLVAAGAADRALVRNLKPWPAIICPVCAGPTMVIIATMLARPQVIAATLRQ
jgi:hypothetical protein